MDVRRKPRLETRTASTDAVVGSFCPRILEDLTLTLDDAGQSDTAYQMHGAPPIRWARSPQFLLPRLAQLVRSRDRREKAAEDGALRMGCRDARHSTLSFARLPQLHNRGPLADAAYDGFRSSRSRTQMWSKPDVIFSRAHTEIGFSPIRESTVLPIVRAVARKVMFCAVALSTPTRLSDGDKLEVLRLLDQFRQWHSLDEERYCLVCGKLITGQQIQVAGGTRAATDRCG
jgi:hypothetical protein